MIIIDSIHIIQCFNGFYITEYGNYDNMNMGEGPSPKLDGVLKAVKRLLSTL